MEARVKMVRSASISLGRSGEEGFVQALSATTLFVIVLLMFFAVQYAHNTVMGLYYSRVLLSVVQNQQSAPDETSSYQTGSVVARLHGIPGIEAVGGAQTVSIPGESDLIFTMQHDDTRRPAREYARIERSITLLNNFLGILGPQQHIVELTGTSDDSTVYQEFDVSMSMIGPFHDRMIDRHLTRFGIPLDPQRENPNWNLRDWFWPMDTSAATTEEERLVLGHRYRSRLPVYYSGFRALPQTIGDVVTGDRNRLLSGGIYDGQPAYQGAQALLPADGDGTTTPRFLLCDINRSIVNPLSTEQINQPGYRSEIVLPSGARRKLAPWDECVLPWSYTPRFFHATEQAWCAAHSTPGVGELAGTGCATQVGMNRVWFSDFWTDYKSIVEGYVLEVDKVARQVVGVFSGGTGYGPASVGGEEFSGNSILWDGTNYEGTNPLLPDSRIYGLPIDLNETFYQTVGGQVHFKNLGYILAYTRRLKMRLMNPYDDIDPVVASQYEFLEPQDNAERLAILEGSKIIDAVPSPDAAPFSLGGYNTFGLRPDLMPYTWANLYGWFLSGDVLISGTNPSTYFPIAGDTIYPPAPFNIHPSWRYDLPAYRSINPSTGEQTGGTYDPTSETRPNYALPILKALTPTLGGTDLRKAVQDAAVRRQAELTTLGVGEKKKGILVLATDGIPDLSGCSPHLPATFTCTPTPFNEHLNLIKDALDDFEAGGDTLVILLHMLPSGTVSNPQVDEFAALFKPDSPVHVNPNPQGRFYIDLNYGNPSEFGERLQYTLQAIFQMIESFTRLET